MRAGDHIYTRRASFTHHGIYIGNGQVIRYTGLANSLEAEHIDIGPIEEFKAGRQVRVKVIKDRKYTRKEIVERAYRRIGEHGYDFLTNNCEHFATWCVSGLMEAEVNGEKLRPGDHLVTSRFGFTHHGIYVGRWQVIHYAGLSDGLKSGPVELISFAEFTRGEAVRVRAENDARYTRAEIVGRSLTRLGESRYSIPTNNCEHFVNWCINGESRSAQVRTAGLSTLFGW